MRPSLLLFLLISFAGLLRAQVPVFHRGTEHSLGVVELRQQPGELVIIRDTFFLFNTEPRPMRIGPPWTARPFCFRVPKVVNPGETGLIIFADTVRTNLGVLEPTEVRTEIRTDLLLPVTIVSRFTVVGSQQVTRRHPDGSVAEARQPYDNGQRVKVLKAHPNGQPQALGMLLPEQARAIDVWTYWDINGNKSGDSIFPRSTPLQVYHDGQMVYDSLSIRVLKDGQWMEPLQNPRSPAPICYLSEGTDSLEVRSPRGAGTVPVRWPRGSGEQLTLYLLRPGQLYYYFDRMRIPVDFVPQTYFVFITGFAEPERRTGMLDTLKESFPDFHWSPHPYNLSVCRVDLPAGKSLETSGLLNHPLVTRAYAVLKDDGATMEMASYMNGQVFMRFNGGMSRDSMERVLADFGFRLAQHHHPDHIVAEFDARLIAERFLEQYNALTFAPGVVEAYPMIFSYRRAEPE